ncbi:MAG: response regulator [Kiritimatiellae bacterium]|nr:response regulator [Kiritimatiellia bacterium]
MNVIIVEDDVKIAKRLQQGLTEVGYSVTVCHSGMEAVPRIKHMDDALVILDLGLPDCDDIDILKHIRTHRHANPILILTARDTLDDRVSGFDQGADDYLIKPFAFPGLLARIRALLRRSNGGENHELHVGSLKIDRLRRHVQRNGEEIILTPLEFKLLSYLCTHRGQTVSREMLARNVWGIQSRATSIDNVIDVHIFHLRKKIEEPHTERIISTIRGIGYRLGNSI